MEDHCSTVLDSKSFDVCNVVQEALQLEKDRHSKQIHALKVKVKEMSSCSLLHRSEVATLTSMVVDAERLAKNANKQKMMFQECNENTNSLLIVSTKEKKTLVSTVLQLQATIDDNKKKEQVESTSPIMIVEKERTGKGARSWPLFIWEIILEQLVNGTSFSDVNANMVSIIGHFSPQTVIK